MTGGGPPAICPVCGLAFRAWGTAEADADGGVIFAGAPSTTNCPRCQARAEIIAGTYAPIANALVMVEQHGLTVAQIERLRVAAQEAVESGFGLEAFLRDNPEARPLVNSIIQQTTPRTVLLVLLAVLSFVIPYAGAVSGGDRAPPRPQIAQLHEEFRDQLHVHDEAEQRPADPGERAPWQSPELGQIELAYGHPGRVNAPLLPGEYVWLEGVSGGPDFGGWVVSTARDENDGLRLNLSMTPEEAHRAGLIPPAAG
jgi:rubredoxin